MRSGQCGVEGAEGESWGRAEDVDGVCGAHLGERFVGCRGSRLFHRAVTAWLLHGCRMKNGIR